MDVDNQFQLVDQDVMEDTWNGRATTEELPFAVADELRVVTVLCDEDSLAPKMCFFVRTELEKGLITDKSRYAAYDAMTQHNQRLYDVDDENGQFAGWPSDWQSQLAVALDVPAVEINRIGIGGPLLMADLWGFPIEKILEYFDDASTE